MGSESAKRIQDLTTKTAELRKEFEAIIERADGLTKSARTIQQVQDTLWSVE